MTGDVQSAVLVFLKDNPGSSIKQISEATGFSPTAVRNNLKVIEYRGPYGGNPWVRVLKGPGLKYGMWFLTADGLRVAGYRTVTTKEDTQC